MVFSEDKFSILDGRLTQFGAVRFGKDAIVIQIKVACGSDYGAKSQAGGQLHFKIWSKPAGLNRKNEQGESNNLTLKRLILLFLPFFSKSI
jgi:hypothetical protein